MSLWRSIGVVIGLSLPAIGKARAAARRTQCLNNLRNIALGITQFEQTQGRLPVSGNYRVITAAGGTNAHHSWVVSILPWIGQKSLFDKWDLDKPITDPVNEPLTQTHIPVFVCPMDLSRSKKKNQGDLSYVVSGGVGFTVRYTNGVEDCPVDRTWTVLDLNGDGGGCSGGSADDEDRELFKKMGLFFLENWQGGVNMAYTDGHVRFLSERIDRAADATLASPQGMRLQGTPLEQAIVSSESF